ncbi:MAG: signal peptidase II [Clostridia bacterium]|nr:signal peptidase II [Clostridia bacterium]
MKNKKIWSPIIAGIVFALILVLDLVTKEVIISKVLPNVGDSVEVIPGFINFVYVQNKGGAWGIFSNSTIGLTILSVIILALMLVFYIIRIRQVKNKSSMWLAVSVGLIAGGCIGNMVDRIFFGYVRDFINFQFMDFPVFNFADVAICVGVLVLMVYFIFFYSKEEKNIKNVEKNQKNNEKGGEND